MKDKIDKCGKNKQLEGLAVINATIESNAVNPTMESYGR